MLIYFSLASSRTVFFCFRIKIRAEKYLAFDCIEDFE